MSTSACRQAWTQTRETRGQTCPCGQHSSGGRNRWTYSIYSKGLCRVRFMGNLRFEVSRESIQKLHCSHRKPRFQAKSFCFQALGCTSVQLPHSDLTLKSSRLPLALPASFTSPDCQSLDWPVTTRTNLRQHSGLLCKIQNNHGTEINQTIWCCKELYFELLCVLYKQKT